MRIVVQECDNWDPRQAGRERKGDFGAVMHLDQGWIERLQCIRHRGGVAKIGAAEGPERGRDG